MINTIYGMMDESELEKKTGSTDNENESTEWIEYWKGDELVHRSVHLTLKKTVTAELMAANLG